MLSARPITFGRIGHIRSELITLDRIAKDIFHTPGIARMQSITRPLGSPIERSSIPFQISMQSLPIRQNLQFMKDRMADMLITRALVASLMIVGTALVSLGAAFGLSVLIWQHLLGRDLNWIAPVFGVIILLAVGSDYNLLLVSRFQEEVSRFQEEIGAGIKAGIIRSMGETGGVVTAAGLVIAFTMASMIASDLSSIGQAGSTIGLGLLFDTLIVRSLMTPSIAALLGPWFWWPQKVRQRPASQMLRPYGPRPTVRKLLQGESENIG